VGTKATHGRTDPTEVQNNLMQITPSDPDEVFDREQIDWNYSRDDRKQISQGVGTQATSFSKYVENLTRRDMKTSRQRESSRPRGKSMLTDAESRQQQMYEKFGQDPRIVVKRSPKRVTSDAHGFVKEFWGSIPVARGTAMNVRSDSFGTPQSRALSGEVKTTQSAGIGGATLPHNLVGNSTNPSVSAALQRSKNIAAELRVEKSDASIYVGIGAVFQDVDRKLHVKDRNDHLRVAEQRRADRARHEGLASKQHISKQPKRASPTKTKSKNFSVVDKRNARRTAAALAEIHSARIISTRKAQASMASAIITAAHPSSKKLSKKLEEEAMKIHSAGTSSRSLGDINVTPLNTKKEMNTRTSTVRRPRSAKVNKRVKLSNASSNLSPQSPTKMNLWGSSENESAVFRSAALEIEAHLSEGLRSLELKRAQMLAASPKRKAVVETRNHEIRDERMMLFDSVFERIIEKSSSFGPLLRMVKSEYDDRMISSVANAKANEKISYGDQMESKEESLASQTVLHRGRENEKGGDDGASLRSRLALAEAAKAEITRTEERTRESLRKAQRDIVELQRQVMKQKDSMELLRGEIITKEVSDEHQLKPYIDEIDKLRAQNNDLLAYIDSLESGTIDRGKLFAESSESQDQPENTKVDSSGSKQFLESAIESLIKASEGVNDLISPRRQAKPQAGKLVRSTVAKEKDSPKRENKLACGDSPTAVDNGRESNELILESEFMHVKSDEEEDTMEYSDDEDDGVDDGGIDHNSGNGNGNMATQLPKQSSATKLKFPSPTLKPSDIYDIPSPMSATGGEASTSTCSQKDEGDDNLQAPVLLEAVPVPSEGTSVKGRVIDTRYEFCQFN
jgi:CRISPR/Cas system-associated protein endoribonuclease Cas2